VLEDTDDDKRSERLKQVQQQSLLRKSKPAVEADDEDPTRPGEFYRRYRAVEELPKEAKVFYDIAGKV